MIVHEYLVNLQIGVPDGCTRDDIQKRILLCLVGKLNDGVEPGTLVFPEALIMRIGVSEPS